MEPKPLTAWSLVRIPAVITLVVTVLRLVGELAGWNDSLFSNIAPNAEEWKPGWVGISWLMPIFGFWFGFRLRRSTAEPERRGRALLLILIAIGVLAGGMWGLIELGLVTMPGADNAGEPSGLGFMLAVFLIAIVIGLAAWWRLGRVMLLYAILARIPVIVVTYFAVHYEWDTHYNKPPPGLAPQQGDELFLMLAAPQATFWIVLTVLTGGLTGCIAAAVTRGARS